MRKDSVCLSKDELLDILNNYPFEVCNWVFGLQILEKRPMR